MPDYPSKNYVLIGPPGCGKTTLGKLVAEKENFLFRDIDTTIIERNMIQKSDRSMLDVIRRIPKIQSEFIRELLNTDHSAPLLIAAGAGSVDELEDTANLRQIGCIVALRRDRSLRLEAAKERFPFVLDSNNGEPKEDASAFMLDMYEMGSPPYEKIADVVCDNNGTLDEGVENLINLIRSRANKSG